MADNYLERRRAEYEKRKALWLKYRKRSKLEIHHREIPRQDDESL